jgi:ribosomal protein S18 acetylase RimI-like enzyme
MEIVQTHKSSELQKIEDLAYKIIPEFYTGIIPHDHNIFFVKKFQTVEAICRQIKAGYEYYLINIDNNSIGYFGLQIDLEKSNMLLSKLYILKEHRGLGYGTKAMDYIIERANNLKIKNISLTVNRENKKTINLYNKYGFSVTKELVNQFENGHTILDFEMTRINNQLV